MLMDLQLLLASILTCSLLLFNPFVILMPAEEAVVSLSYFEAKTTRSKTPRYFLYRSLSSWTIITRGNSGDSVSFSWTSKDSSLSESYCLSYIVLCAWEVLIVRASLVKRWLLSNRMSCLFFVFNDPLPVIKTLLKRCFQRRWQLVLLLLEIYNYCLRLSYQLQCCYLVRS